eukprot:CAMPEP_0115087576 /NCGR_PEP_ID=MMETSP0227-20121206/23390_1 /TAXON_ID=89957 /ORGANISM="Polarella glacialis, Strain CCMP 1383" /LENGTH=758 /DNA_ID=CAMNT_0002477505 /DNA_START=88 /DNA_END=2364 /DNA_ORIENTATION=+
MNPYGQQGGGYGYGMPQQGFQGQGDYWAQQAAMQQQWAQQQQGWGGQQQQGQQQQGQQGQQQQGYGQQQQYGGYGQQGQQGGQQGFNQQMPGGKGGFPGAQPIQPGPHGQGNEDDFRSSGKGGGKNSGGNTGGGAGGKGGAQGAGAKGGAQLPPPSGPKKAASSEMTFEEYKAAEVARKAQKAIEQKAKAKAAAEARANAPPEEEEKPAPKVEAKPVEVAKPKEPEPVAPEPVVEQAEEKEDWEDEAEEKEEEPTPAPVVKAPEPPAPVAVKEPAPVAAAAVEEEEVYEEEEDWTKKPVKVDDGKKVLATPDPRPHLNVVFIGHVDAGKSTTCGNILYLSGCVDERTIEKYQKEAKDRNRDSWFLAYIMDTSEEEKAKGKTVEVGRAHFETPNRRFTVLDAPGHKSYVPNMISGASQADVGVLIISARKGEFETGFERGGQTREHALLAKTLGVEKILIAINKMDDPSVEWKQERYDVIKNKLSPFLKQCGFKDDQIIFIAMSGLTGDNIKERLNCPEWVPGDPLLTILDKIETPSRKNDAPLRIPMMEGFKDMGATLAIGKVEQGTVKPGMKVMIMPIGHKATVLGVCINEEDMQYACCGENVTLRMSGITDEQLGKGYVMTEVKDPVRVVTKFKAQLHVIELPDERPVLTSGYKAVIHISTAVEECEILKLYESISMGKDKKKEANPRFCRENSVLTCSISLARSCAVDIFSGVQNLGRFTLRDEGRTIAIGKIIELPKELSKEEELARKAGSGKK